MFESTYSSSMFSYRLVFKWSAYHVQPLTAHKGAPTLEE